VKTASIEQDHYGYTIRVDEEGVGKVARVLRRGECIYKVEREEVGDAFEAAWAWACMNRPVEVRVVSNLIEHHVEVEDHNGGRKKVYTTTTRSLADEAEMVLLSLLREQWRADLEEHEHRRENLAAHLEELRGKVDQVEREMEPLKLRRRDLKEEMEAAPVRVYRPTTGRSAVDELAPVMARRAAGGRLGAKADDDHWAESQFAERAGELTDDDYRELGAAFEDKPEGSVTVKFGDKVIGTIVADGAVSDALQKVAGKVYDLAANGPKKRAKVPKTKADLDEVAEEAVVAEPFVEPGRKAPKKQPRSRGKKSE